MQVEGRIKPDVIEELKTRGHKIDVRGDFSSGSAPTIIIYDPNSKVIQAGADVRRGRYAIGW
jgi:gamma-glutamyltranspeptidase